jgi:hypothetical protein
MSRQSIEIAANVNYVPFIEQKSEICVNLVSNFGVTFPKLGVTRSETSVAHPLTLARRQG